MAVVFHRLAAGLTLQTGRAPFLSRVVGAMYGFGGVWVLVSLLLHHPSGGDDDATLRIINAAMFVIGAAYLVAASRLPRWVAFMGLAGFSALVSAGILATGVAAGVYSMMFVWVVLLSACFFSPTAALAQLGWALALYGMVLARATDYAGFSPFTRWLLTAVVLAVAGGVTAWLVAHGKATEDRADRFFRLSRDMLCTANRDGYFVELNQAWSDTLGYSREELRARPFVDFVHPDDRESTIAEASQLFTGVETVLFQNRYLAKDGSWHWLDWSSKFDATRNLIYARATDVTEHKRLESEREHLVETLRSQARRDSLTNLPNRRWFAEEIVREVSRASRQGFPMCAAMVDLDRFKLYNDEHGHPAGDRLLRESADAWIHTLRATDFMARYGGEEFVVLLPDCTLPDARVVIERLRAATPGGQTCSAGIAALETGESPEHLLARADAALYAAKAAGRDRTIVAAGAVPMPVS
jgi:diguanylate cyclase (GGDEF)-like protein/PAS domain S-box-containing protein